MPRLRVYFLDISGAWAASQLIVTGENAGHSIWIDVINEINIGMASL
jgi:hypothetical protein